MKVLEAKEAYPINVRGGLYVLTEGTEAEIYKGEADRLAVATATGLVGKETGKRASGSEQGRNRSVHARLLVS